jgi:hypothetical protein
VDADAEEAALQAALALSMVESVAGGGGGAQPVLPWNEDSEDEQMRRAIELSLGAASNARQPRPERADGAQAKQAGQATKQLHEVICIDLSDSEDEGTGKGIANGAAQRAAAAAEQPESVRAAAQACGQAAGAKAADAVGEGRAASEGEEDAPPLGLRKLREARQRHFAALMQASAAGMGGTA